jgi:hypothetical protein
MPQVKPSLCIIISFFDERSSNKLINLLDSLKAVISNQALNSRFLTTIAVSVNTVSNSAIDLPDRFSDLTVIYQQNRGFNMGAWDNGWRHFSGHRHYLFLQDECEVVRDDCLQHYWQLLEKSDPSFIVGESLQLWKNWDQLGSKWPIGKETMICMASAMKIPLGRTPSHLQTIALAASDKTLKQLGGFILADDKIEAVSAEVLFSRRAVSRSVRLKQSAWRPFQYFSHEQWNDVRTRSRKPSWHCSRTLHMAREFIYRNLG